MLATAWGYQCQTSDESRHKCKCRTWMNLMLSIIILHFNTGFVQTAVHAMAGLQWTHTLHWSTVHTAELNFFFESQHNFAPYYWRSEIIHHRTVNIKDPYFGMHWDIIGKYIEMHFGKKSHHHRLMAVDSYVPRDSNFATWILVRQTLRYRKRHACAFWHRTWP